MILFYGEFQGCKIYGFVTSTAALAEIWSLSAVSYDRLLTILYPLNNSKRIKKTQVDMKYLIICIRNALCKVDQFMSDL